MNSFYIGINIYPQDLCGFNKEFAKHKEEYPVAINWADSNISVSFLYTAEEAISHGWFDKDGNKLSYGSPRTAAWTTLVIGFDDESDAINFATLVEKGAKFYY